MNRILVLHSLLMATVNFAAAAELTIEGVWARATPPNTVNGAVFASLNNTTATEERLLSATCDAAKEVQLHTVEVSADGVKAMRQVPFIAVPPSTTVVLKPGSFHIMLMGLNRPLVAGEKLPLTLTFASGVRTVQVPVGEATATGPSAEKCPLCDEKTKPAPKTP